MVVVIKTAHETGVHRVFDPHGAHALFEFGQKRERLFAEEVEKFRRRVHHVLHVGILGVENTQGVGKQPALRVFIQHVGVFLEVGNQRLAMLCAFIDFTEAV